MTQGHNYHDDAPTDADGYPVHPEHDYHICGRSKTGRATGDRLREDIPYCLQAAGHGVDDKKGPGQACSKHGGAGGAPAGPRNGQWELGLYSEYLTDNDRERAEDWLEMADGERLSVADFVRMGEKALLFEFTRIERAMLMAPDPDLSEKYCCQYCGWDLASRDILVCPNCETHLKAEEGDVLTTAEWVDMHDRAISERIERWVEMLKKYKEVVEGTDMNVSLGADFESAIRRAQEITEADSDEKVEYLVGEQ